MVITSLTICSTILISSDEMKERNLQVYLYMLITIRQFGNSISLEL